jgi:hypothetical protein
MSLSLEIAPENMAYKRIFVYASSATQVIWIVILMVDAIHAPALCRPMCLCNALNASVSRFGLPTPVSIARN